MRVILVTTGTRGDTQPYIALAEGLNRRGHEAILLAPADIADTCRDLGIQHIPIQAHFRDLTQNNAAGNLLQAESNPLRLLQRLKVVLSSDLAQICDKVIEVSRKADVLVCNVAILSLAKTLAETLSIPVINSSLQPVYETDQEPMLLLPLLPIRIPGLNRRTWRAIWWILWKLMADSVNQIRSERLGLRPQGYSGYVDSLCQMPLLSAYSEQVSPTPYDANPMPAICGYWVLAADDYLPPPRLAEFLKSGPPPIYIGFGSMNSKDPQKLTQIMIEALRQTGQRCVLCTGWGGLSIQDLPDTVLPIEGAPHEWLLPRMAAAIHHGGAGTTAAVLRAGVPGMVIPFLADQPYWGRRAAALGVALPPLKHSQLSVKPLTEAIRRLTSDHLLQARAKALGTRLRSEDGIGCAVTYLEALNRT